MNELGPLITLAHTLGIERADDETDGEFAVRILAEVARLQHCERSERRTRRLGWAFRAALAAAGIGFIGL